MNEEHSERAMDVASSSIGGMLEDVRRSDPRGHMHRFKRLMADDDARAFLRSQNVAHVGTVDERGWPYVVPLIYIYEGGDRLYVHTGNHDGHFQRNIQSQPRTCVEVAEMGPVHRGIPSPAIQRSSTRA